MNTKYCKYCDKTIRKSNWARHAAGAEHKRRRGATKTNHCDVCNRDISRPQWANHINSKAHADKLHPFVHCEVCDKELRKSSWRGHIKSKTHLENAQVEEEQQEENHEEADPTNTPDVKIMFTNPAFIGDREEIKEFLLNNQERVWSYGDTEANIFSDYSVQASTTKSLKKRLWRIFRRQGHAFKINVYISGVGTTGFDPNFGDEEEDEIVEPTLEQKYKLMATNNKMTLFNPRADNGLPQMENMVITDRDSFEVFLSYITRDNFRRILEAFQMQGSGFQPIGVTDFWIKIAKLSTPLGANIHNLPADVLNSKSLCAMSNVTGNLCFFHCVALFNKLAENGRTPGAQRITKPAKNLFESFYGKKHKPDYPGITPVEIDQFQHLIEKNIEVFVFGKSIKDISTLMLPSKRYQQTISLLQYNNHLMLITKRDTILGKFQCEKCNEFFSEQYNLTKHRKRGNCQLVREEGASAFPTETRVWGQPKGDLENLLRNYGQHVTLERDHILTWDFEASTDTSKKKEGRSLHFLGQQVPMSFSVAWKFPEQPIQRRTLLIDDCNSDPFELTKQFVDLIVQLSIESFNYNKIKYSGLWCKMVKNVKTRDMITFINAVALPCIGFNSGKYDINLLTRFGFYHELFLNVHGNHSVIPGKLIQCNSTRFVDQLLWTPSSLDSFVKSYHPIISKEDFPVPKIDYAREARNPFDTNHFLPVTFGIKSNKPKEICRWKRIIKKAQEQGVETMRDYLALFASIEPTSPSSSSTTICGINR